MHSYVQINMLQQWYGLADMAVEYHITTAIVYRFLGLEVGVKLRMANNLGFRKL
jgi:hypothetical protein